MVVQPRADMLYGHIAVLQSAGIEPEVIEAIDETIVSAFGSCIDRGERMPTPSAAAEAIGRRIKVATPEDRPAHGFVSFAEGPGESRPTSSSYK